MSELGQADRDALDRAYNARAATEHFDRETIYRERSEAARAAGERIADIVYDETSGSRLDIHPAGAGSPLFVWIHGGYWRSSSKNDNAFVAPALVAHGISVANIDYTLAPAASLDEIVRQTRASLAWLHGNAQTYGIDARRVHVGGHSAGGHLTGMALCDNWMDAFDVPSDIVATALPISGLFDLHPLRHTFVNEPLELDAVAAARNSPLEHLPRQTSARLLATCGGAESGAFQRQTTDYLAAWIARGFAGQGLAMPGFHHFDIILELERPDSALFQALLANISATA